MIADHSMTGITCNELNFSVTNANGRDDSRDQQNLNSATQFHSPAAMFQQPIHDPLRGDVMTAFLQSRPGPRRSLGGHLPIFRRHHHRENYPGARCHGGNTTAGWSLMVVDYCSSLSVADALNVIYGDYP